jgi:hypothetical protein
MENGQFLEKLLAVVSGNTTVISELRKVVEKLQDKLYDLPDKAEFKAYDKTCSAIDLTVGDIKDAVVKIDGRLDEIDKWQKVRLPIVVGLLTLIIYAIGFFFTIDKVADMINERHEQPAQEEIQK